MSDPVQDQEDIPLPTNAEDAKTLKALSNLDSHDDGTTNTTSGADAEALGKATAGLGGVGSAKTGDTGKKVVVKINGEDVGVVVEELEVSKTKATELLRANGGDLRRTLRSAVLPAEVVV